ncbi:MAG: cyclophilin-like fold protein [Mesonia sp.]
MQKTIEVILKVGEKEFKVNFNNSTTAQDVLSKLAYMVNLDQYEFDYCGIIPAPLAFDEADKHNGWTNGDICLADNYFTILYAGEEQSASHMGLIKIGEVEDKNQLSEIKNLGSNIRLTVSRSV